MAGAAEMLKLYRIALSLLALATGSQVNAERPSGIPSAAVEKARTSILNDVEDIFMEVWPRHESVVADKLSADEARAAGLWIVLGVSLGQCSPYAGVDDYPDWLLKFRDLKFKSREAMIASRRRGIAVYSEASKDAITSPRRRQFCVAELAAIRGILAEADQFASPTPAEVPPLPPAGTE